MENFNSKHQHLSPNLWRGVVQFMDEMYRQKYILKKESIRLKKKILQENIINWSRGVKNWSTSSGMFVRKGGYKPGEHSYTYDFSKQAAKLNWQCQKISDKILYRSMKRRQDKMTAKLTVIELWLKNNIDRIGIDWQTFREDMDRTRRDYLQSIKTGGLNRKAKRKRWKQFVLAEWTFKQLKAGQYWFYHDEFAGRVHSPITSLPTIARKYLRGPSGNPLVELDVGCSQPLFVAVAAKEAGFHCPEYQAECEAGTLYDTILAESGDPDIKTRKDAKRAMFRYLYRAGRYGSTSIDAFIQKKYPTFNTFVKLEKSAKSGNITLAKKMQRLESDLVIQNLCQRILKFDPSAFVVTIHDSLLVEKVPSDLFQGWFTEAFDSLGVSVHINKR